MTQETTIDKKQKRKDTFKRVLRSIGIGLLEGGICGLLGFLFTLINDFSLFGIVGIWLILGWFSTLFIELRTYEILTVIIVGVLISMGIYYIIGIPIWFSTIITGLSLLLWMIGFVSKIFLNPKTKIHEE